MHRIKEFWIKENQILIDIDEHLICITAVGDMNETLAKKVQALMFGAFSEANDPFDVIIDLNKSGKQTPEARRIWNDLNDNPNIRCVAYIGVHPVARITASFLKGIASNKNMKFFSTIEKAKEWLNNIKTQDGRN